MDQTSAAPPATLATTETWDALGTSAILRHSGPANPAARTAVERELDAIDAAASRFRADSELSRLNAMTGPGPRTLVVGPLFAQAVRLAILAADASGGAVDPTLAPELVALGYDRDWHELVAVPSGAPLSDGGGIGVYRRRRQRWQEMEVADDPPRVTLPPGVQLDLGATAKALAADLAARAAHEAGAVDVLVALGGDIATCGPEPAGGWPIHVTDDHRDGPDAPGQTIVIRSGGVATSSIATRRWQHGRRSVHHILDPRSGRPVRGPWRTVSVAAATCAEANIASTAAMVLGDDAPAWLAEQGLPARLVALDGSAVVQGGWPR
ncbi:MAG TPA: FAD:protein FMN transferase [Solirubrobacteraceae bacterium]|jgi:thiamine biosynthesis lipoprotein|nr:FAD:protein FMN transferase [Solirubrobacteraceae bacterium]